MVEKQEGQRDRKDRDRYVVEEEPARSIDRRTFVKGGAAVAGAAWVGALGGSVVKSVTTKTQEDTGTSRRVFVYHVPEGESPWYSDLDGSDVMADGFPPGETAKVFVKGRKSILLKLDETLMVDRTGTDQGFVAFESTCTHLGCQVYFISDETPVGHYPDGIIYCPCHQGAFDPYMAAQVIYGPPPRPLLRIPLRVVDGRLEAV
jgi:Rieske Fe-S protein